MDMGWPGLRVIAAFALVAAGISGCGAARAQADGPAAGDWAGCQQAALPSAVQVSRSVALPLPGHRGYLSVTQRRAPVVRTLFHDMCVIVGHPAPLPGIVNCPADYGLTYSGVFYAGNRKLATFSYRASGCQYLSLTAGSQHASTMIIGRAAAAEPASFDADFAAVLGFPVGIVHLPPSRGS